MSADWKAGSYSADGSQITENIILPSGTYLINLVVPTFSYYPKLIYMYDGTTVVTSYLTVNEAYASKSFIFTCTAQKTCHLRLGQSGSITISNIDRGQFTAIKLA